MTNGTIQNENYLNLIAQSAAYNISFSLDGPEEINDTIRGVKGSFRKTIKTIEYFNSINKRKIPVTIVTTISKDSFSDLPKMVGIAKKMHARLYIVHLQFLEKDVIDEHLRSTGTAFGQASDCSRWLAERFSQGDVDKIIKNIQLCKDLAQKEQIDIDFLPNLKEEDTYSYYLDKGYNHEKTCRLPFNQIVVNPYGEVYPCFPERFDFSIGNIRKENISDMINNDRRKEVLNFIMNQGIFPGCIRCCSLKIKKPDKILRYAKLNENTRCACIK